MSQHTTLRSGAQFQSLFRSLVLDPTLLFAHILSTEIIAQIVLEEIGETTDRIFTPLVTLATFLSQILSDDHSCRGAVARLKAWRSCPWFAPLLTGDRRLLQGTATPARVALAATGVPHLGSSPGASPRRLGFSRAAGRHGRWVLRLHARHGQEPKGVPPALPPEARLRLPDRPDRRPPIPGHRGSSRPGHSAWSGKLTGENALLRGLRNRLQRGSILLADSYYSSYQEVAALISTGVDVVMRQHGGRPTNFDKGRRLGHEDHLVEWQRGRQRRSWMRLWEFHRLPRSIVMRELRVRIDKKGFRTRQIVIVTSLLDPVEYPASELATLYRARWHAEVCQADCISRYTLYQSRGPAHSGRGGFVETGTMEPETLANEPRRTAMRRLSERLGPPQPGWTGAYCPSEPTLEGVARPFPPGSAHEPHSVSGPAAASPSGGAGGVP